MVSKCAWGSNVREEIGEIGLVIFTWFDSLPEEGFARIGHFAWRPAWLFYFYAKDSFLSSKQERSLPPKKSEKKKRRNDDRTILSRRASKVKLSERKENYRQKSAVTTNEEFCMDWSFSLDLEKSNWRNISRKRILHGLHEPWRIGHFYLIWRSQIGETFREKGFCTDWSFLFDLEKLASLVILYLWKRVIFVK